MAEKVNRSEGWVSRGITRLEIKTEPRRDQQGVTRQHYPPETAQQLIQEKEHLGRLGSRQTKGLNLRLSILEALSGFQQSVTVSRIRKESGHKLQEKRVYDALLWLKRQGFVTIASPRKGHRKSRWRITEAGRSVIHTGPPKE